MPVAVLSCEPSLFRTLCACAVSRFMSTVTQLTLLLTEGSCIPEQ